MPQAIRRMESQPWRIAVGVAGIKRYIIAKIAEVAIMRKDLCLRTQARGKCWNDFRRRRVEKSKGRNYMSYKITLISILLVV